MQVPGKGRKGWWADPSNSPWPCCLHKSWFHFAFWTFPSCSEGYYSFTMEGLPRQAAQHGSHSVNSPATQTWKWPPFQGCTPAGSPLVYRPFYSVLSNLPPVSRPLGTRNWKYQSFSGLRPSPAEVAGWGKSVLTTGIICAWKFRTGLSPQTWVLCYLSWNKIPGMRVIKTPFVPPVSLKVLASRCPRFSFLMEFLS